VLSREETIHLSFGDADPAGVVFYPRALALAHQAVESLLRHSSLGWDNWFASPTHAAPLRRAEAEFCLPLRPGEQITARTSVEKVGKTSVTFRVDFLNAEGQTAANILTTHVLIDKATGRAVPLLDEIRSAFGA
jgi:YbgC/YbaW family acyl-CoA thioester hydrolase